MSSGTITDYGWHPDWDYAAASRAKNPFWSIAQAAPHAAADEKRETFLWRILWTVLRDITGGQYQWRPQFQQHGTCVGQGWKLGADTLLAIQYMIGRRDGARTQFPGRASVASLYAGGRVESAGQPGRWDGSNGDWTADFVKNFGVGLLVDLSLPEDARDEDEQLAVQWAADRNGIPQKFEDMCKSRPCKSTVVVRSFDEAAIAIQNLCPVPNCSDLIPSGPLDKDGFFTQMDRGGHCQLFWGVRYDKPGLWQQNSWGENFGARKIGETYPGDSPTGGGWVKPQWVDDILGQNDSHAISDVQGIPQRSMDDLGFSSFLN